MYNNNKIMQNMHGKLYFKGQKRSETHGIVNHGILKNLTLISSKYKANAIFSRYGVFFAFFLNSRGKN
jgi:hypothetical protein